ncbi:MAG: C2H2-type zinc finger protein, partial [Candidatus Thorarchaeota archaeon]
LIHFLSGQPFGKKYEALRVPRIFRVQWYPCPHCDYKAKQKDNLTRHLVDKHDIGAQWYPCPQCDYKAKQKSNLIRHLANKHDTGPVFKHLADISGTTFVGSNFQIGES